MTPSQSPSTIHSLRERAAGVGDSLRGTFGLPAALAMAIGLIVGLALPELDRALGVHVPLFVFSTQEAARGMLETIATVTVAVAGLSFSVTIVAFTLSSNQLSPRVLRSFRRDLISQLTLAAFLGTFIYCLAVLVRLGALGADRVPNLSISVAVVLALLSFGLFAGFIGHITNMLQPSSIIASILAGASSEDRCYPARIGAEPSDPRQAAADAAAFAAERPAAGVCSGSEGFLTAIRGEEIVKLARESNGLVRQRARIGQYVLPGDLLAEAWAPSAAESTELAERSVARFEFGRQRTVPQDPAFPVRQLADVALKGLSPGINDPTTAQTAIEAMTARLIHFARTPVPSPVRADEQDRPRLVAEVPGLDDLVRVGFDQVRLFAATDPSFVSRLLELLSSLRAVAREQGRSEEEIDRQASLIAAAAASNGQG